MSPGDAVTIGELSRSLEGLERRMDARFDTIGKRLDSLQFVGREAYAIRDKQVEERLKDLEDSRRWMIRTLVAAFVSPLAVAVIVALVVAR